MERPEFEIAAAFFEKVVMQESITASLTPAAVERGDQTNILANYANVIQEFGGFLGLIDSKVEDKEEATTQVTFKGMFESATHVEFVIAVRGKLVDSVTVVKGSKPQEASYANKQTFEEKEVTIGGEKPYSSIAKLTRGKKQEKKVPAVVIAAADHIDGGIMQKPAKDIAEGLSSLYGVVTLRFTPRIFRMAEQQDFESIMKLTVRSEVMEDVFFSLEYIYANAEELNVDPARIYVLGTGSHGYVLPRIARMRRFEEAKYGYLPIAGYISVGGSSRPLHESIEESLPAMPQEFREMASQDIARLKKGLESTLHNNGVPDEEMVFQLPMCFWRNKFSQDDTLEMQMLYVDKPFLVMHGEYDPSVNEKDLARWKQVLNNHQATFKAYKRLNRSMVDAYIEGEAPGVQVNEKQGHVDVQVIQDLAEFLLQ